VRPDELASIDVLVRALGAELAATRKLTDAGWIPRARQVGITGHSISPRLLITIGVSGKFNHAIGSRSAGTVLAINSDRSAPVFEWADLGIVAPWQDVVPLLAEMLRQQLEAISAAGSTGGSRAKLLDLKISVGVQPSDRSLVDLPDARVGQAVDDRPPLR
jgi:hypothetical protein